MCGICGIRRFSDVPISREMIDLLIVNNQNRGLEAAGIALQQADGTVQIYKNDITPLQFVASYDYKKFMEEHLRDDTLIVLGHTRKATKGSPRVIANNHPMFAGKTAVVHNGTIHNDDWGFKEWKLDRKAETDSDIFRAILDEDGFSARAINKFSRLTGNAAFAAISPEFPGKLLLGRSGNPLELAGTPDFLAFSSERGPLYKALRPFKRVWGILMREMTPINYTMMGMEDNTAWLFGDKPRDGKADWAGNWLEWHQQMQICYNFNPVTYQCNAQFRGQRIKFYDDRPVDVVQCPNKKCGLYIPVPPSALKDLQRFTCSTCKTKLS